jgi:hypothetical protein
VSYTLKLGEGRKARAEVAATGIRGGGDSPLEFVEVGQSPMLGNGKMGKEEDGEDLRCTWGGGELVRRTCGEERCRWT